MASTFLNVPLEIRNQIYEYLVIFNISPTPDPPNKERYWVPFNTLSLDLSIIRVNKQVHEEASTVLYSQNIFPIRFKIIGTDFCKPIENCNSHFSVTYQTLWEDVHYRRTFGEEYSQTVKYTTEVSRGSYPFTRIKKDEVIQIPSPRYQHLIRRAKIAIYDLRVTAFAPSDPNTGEPIDNDTLPRDATWRKSVTSILMPFVRARLRSIISEWEKASLDIEMLPSFLHPTSHPDALARNLTEKEVDALNVKYLKELTYTAWPLTTLPGRYSLRLDHPAERRFRDIKKDALRECDDEVVFEKEEEEGFNEMNLENSYSWAIERGKLVVVGDWHQYPRSRKIYCFGGPRPRPQESKST
ncbi:hypothetical protein TWF594_004329 [Orbilia oligospora]|uniref:F-box domain-containing protein n=1 Tax=Orbilia oligospora TaxID=2813651 RepID=A0A7C8JET0_ORBOL|nr:hypothetical protein TWF706_006875 [Orbilia oligospora]KAF3119226.1 hypothetical protein TWF703_003573 [Orbilia oligospora]KAF3145386.1 hypothetical protein TWF594_004329 [Orbilia oligospora]